MRPGIRRGRLLSGSGNERIRRSIDRSGGLHANEQSEGREILQRSMR